LVALSAVEAALWLVAATSGAGPPPAPSDGSGAVADAALPLQPERDRRDPASTAEDRSAERTEAAPAAVRVRVVGPDGAAVAGVAVRLDHAPEIGGRKRLAAATTDDCGECRFDPGAKWGPRERMVVACCPPGCHTVDARLAETSPHDVVVLQLAAVGTFAFSAHGEIANVLVTVKALPPRADERILDGRDDRERRLRASRQETSPTFSFHLEDGASRLPVAAGARYWIQAASDGQRHTLPDVAGPARQGDVVPITFDFERCVVSGRVLGPPQVTLTKAILFAPDLDHGGKLGAFVLDPSFGRGGAFSLRVPRSRWPVTLAFVAGERCAEAGPILTNGPTADAGVMHFSQRPSLGVVTATSESGERIDATEKLVSFRLRDGAELDATWMKGAVLVRETLADTEYFGLPCIDAATVAVHAPDRYPEAASAVVRDGARTTMRMLPAGSATVYLASASSLEPMWLVHVATGERADPFGWRLSHPEARADFRSLRPGEWEVRANRPLLDGRFTVVANQCTEVRARLQR
jgi:hypothetical protein